MVPVRSTVGDEPRAREAGGRFGTDGDDRKVPRSTHSGVACPYSTRCAAAPDFGFCARQPTPGKQARIPRTFSGTGSKLPRHGDSVSLEAWLLAQVTRSGTRRQ